MAVTILERPQGQVLSTTGVSALVSSTYGPGDATFVSVAHGLIDGQYIYVVSNIEDYNGFWYVDVTGPNTFEIYQYQGGDAVQYIQEAEATYYVSELTHGWSAVHLPITYRLSSDLYPTNNVDTVRTISSFSNDDGYVLLNLSGSLGTIYRYDSVVINAIGDDMDGTYQIMEWISSTVVVINLAYDSTYNFSGATIQRYYNNYNIKVRVYSGIGSGHEWQSQKPIRLLTTLELIPDENGEVFFSVNEIIKSLIETKNNPNIGTQPNNIDFWTQFYISVAESYDQSDGYSLGTYTSDFEADATTFLGDAVNADLEFKNVQSGYMSEYIMGPTAGKFLTLFDQPTIFEDVYQDISFIKALEQDYTVYKQFYLNGVAGLLITDTITGDQGVYRYELDQDFAPDFAALSAFTNAGTGTDWVISNTPTVTVLGGSGSKRLRTIFTGISPVLSYTFNYDLTKSGAATVAGFSFNLLDASENNIGSGAFALPTGNKVGSITITSNGSAPIAFFQVGFAALGGSSATVTVNSLTVDPVGDICAYDRVDIWFESNLAPEIETSTGSLILTGFAPTVTVGPA